MLPGKIDLFNVGKQGIDSNAFFFILMDKIYFKLMKKKIAPNVCVCVPTDMYGEV